MTLARGKAYKLDKSHCRAHFIATFRLALIPPCCDEGSKVANDSAFNALSNSHVWVNGNARGLPELLHQIGKASTDRAF